MFGYSATRPVHNSDWYYAIWENCKAFGIEIEGWHTESGPGVYEAALEYGEVGEMADRAGLFKYAQESRVHDIQEIVHQEPIPNTLQICRQIYFI